MIRVWKTTGCSPIPVPQGIAWEVVYNNDLESGKRTSRSFDHHFFHDDSDMWSAITGIQGLEHDPTLHGGGLQVLDPGGFLGVHLDYRYHPVVPAKVRAVSVVSFMNAEWKPEWGGALTFNRPDGSVWKRVYPEPFTCIAFECLETGYHGVEKVNGPEPRITLAKSLLLPAGRSRALFMPNRM